MPNLQKVNRICLVICLVTIVTASLIALLAVSGVIGEDTHLMWRALGTCAILFFASAVTMAVLNTYRSVTRKDQPSESPPAK